jgi:hypothetical protein
MVHRLKGQGGTMRIVAILASVCDPCERDAPGPYAVTALGNGPDGTSTRTYSSLRDALNCFLCDSDPGQVRFVDGAGNVWFEISMGERREIDCGRAVLDMVGLAGIEELEYRRLRASEFTVSVELDHARATADAAWRAYAIRREEYQGRIVVSTDDAGNITKVVNRADYIDPVCGVCAAPYGHLTGCPDYSL